MQLQKHRRTISGIALISVSVLIGAYSLSHSLMSRYDALKSVEVLDRNGVAISVSPNTKGHYALYDTKLPDDFKALLLKKEDRFFYYHPGVNPISVLRAIARKIVTGKAGASSTITQQLVKILLGNEDERTVANKLIELAYTFSLELFHSKDSILSMYANSVYLGNQVQGFTWASTYYFDREIENLPPSDQVRLLATLSSPSVRHPWNKQNIAASVALAGRLGIAFDHDTSFHETEHSFRTATMFELSTLGIDCTSSCHTTIDHELTEQIRSLLAHGVAQAYDRGVRHGAVVVIHVPTNDVLALVGSPDPASLDEGMQINMALEPRPIGSTIKPFIYLKGFEQGLRPYTTVEDREYKYPIATGFPLYPKNYDGQYRGVVTLHEALSNSLNVPTVKVLEYVGLEQFYQFMQRDLYFSPIQDWSQYQYGIALGGLEMDLLTLGHLFTIFPNQGELKPLRITHGAPIDTDILSPQTNIKKNVSIIEPRFTQLVTKLLSDRTRGVNQFGLTSNLNVSLPHYAVKTGTSRDFHDSWVIGYTPDFVVGVWLGNSQNTALAQVTGQTGAGFVWRSVMELMADTSYHSGSSFSDEFVIDIPLNGSLEYGLLGDKPEQHQTRFAEDTLIRSPHPDDRFELHPELEIPFIAGEIVTWVVDGHEHATAQTWYFKPEQSGVYTIEAHGPQARELITIEVISND